MAPPSGNLLQFFLLNFSLSVLNFNKLCYGHIFGAEIQLQYHFVSDQFKVWKHFFLLEVMMTVRELPIVVTVIKKKIV